MHRYIVQRALRTCIDTPLRERDEHAYEGRSICNENSPVYTKVLYLHTS